MTAMKYGSILHVDEVRLPEESVGTCKFSKRCKNFNVPLGNGICIVCWDKGLDGKNAYHRNRDKMHKPRGKNGRYE